MNLFKKSYLRTKNNSGDIVYAEIPSIYHINQRRNSMNTGASPELLKQQLKSVNNMINDVTRGITSSNRSFDSKGQAKARVKDTKELLKERQSIIKQLAGLGIKVIPQSLYGSKIEYIESTSTNEGGNLAMTTYTDKDIDEMRLSIYEAANSGEISEALKDYLLLTVESTIEDYNDYVCDQNLRQLWVEEAEENYKKNKVFIYESFYNGSISEDQMVSMLESLGDQEDYVDKEVASKEAVKKINDTNNADMSGVSNDVAEESGKEYLHELASLYMEACINGDEDAKSRIKEKITYLQEKMDGEVENAKLSVVKRKLKEAEANLDDIDRDKLKIMKGRVSGGKGDIEDLKDEEPIKESGDIPAEIEFQGAVSNEALEEFSTEVLATEAYNNLSDEEKERMHEFFESVN